jgi:hypothetical protein
VLPDPPLFSSSPLVGWAIIAAIAIAALWLALKIVRRAIRLSIRVAFAVGVLALIAAGLCWLIFMGRSVPLPVL